MRLDHLPHPVALLGRRLVAPGVLGQQDYVALGVFHRLFFLRKSQQVLLPTLAAVFIRMQNPGDKVIVLNQFG